MEKHKLPNATAVLILGIFSILTCCCYGIPGLIFGIIALVLASKDMALYRQEPEKYLDYNNLNVGRILAIIGISLSAVYLAVTIFAYVVIGEDGIKEWQENLQNKIEYEQQQ